MNPKYKRPLLRNHGLQWHRTMATVKAMTSESCFYGASVCLDFANHFYTQSRKKKHYWIEPKCLSAQCLQFFSGWHWVGIWLGFACLSETLNIIMSATNSNQCHIKIKSYTKYNRDGMIHAFRTQNWYSEDSHSSHKAKETNNRHMK